VKSKPSGCGGDSRIVAEPPAEPLRRGCAMRREQCETFVTMWHPEAEASGRSVWRVLYACSGERRYMLLAVTRTPRVSPRAFRSGVEKACRRARQCGLEVG
jgi:hypothetical protein